MNARIGLDLGATTLKAGVVDDQGKVHRSAVLSTDAEGGLEAIETKIDEALALLGAPSLPGAVGLGLPGAIDHQKGTVRFSPNIEAFTDYPARDRLRKRTGRSFVVENDANCAAVAEGWVGAAAGAQSFLMMTLGTGVGGGVVLQGQLWRGDAGRAGEVGHLVVDPGGAPCGCGSRGCLETVASATGILRMASEAGLEGGVEELASRARDGSGPETRIFQRAGEALGIALASWLNVLDVHLIVFGGGVARALDLMQATMRREMARRAYALDPDLVSLQTAHLGNDAGLVGAARLAFLSEA